MTHGEAMIDENDDEIDDIVGPAPKGYKRPVGSVAASNQTTGTAVTVRVQSHSQPPLTNQKRKKQNQAPQD